MPNFLRLPFFNLQGGIRFCRQTQSEAINGVTHTPRKPRCQRPAAKCQGNKYQQSRAQTQTPTQTHPQTRIQCQTVSQIPTTPPCYSLRSTSSSSSSTSSLPALSATACGTKALIASGCASVCVCVWHAPRLLATLGLRPPAFYPLELDSSAAALYAHGVFIKVVFILRDIFGASFALFL